MKWHRPRCLMKYANVWSFYSVQSCPSQTHRIWEVPPRHTAAGQVGVVGVSRNKYGLSGKGTESK